MAAEKEAPLSEITREEILKLIEENGGPEGLGFVARLVDQAVVGLQSWRVSTPAIGSASWRI